MFFSLFIFISFDLVNSAFGLPRSSKCCPKDQLVVSTTRWKYKCVDHKASDKANFSYINIFNDKGTDQKAVLYNSVFDVTLNAFKDPSFQENARPPRYFRTVDHVYINENAVLFIHDSEDQSLTKMKHPNFCFDYFRARVNTTFLGFWYNVKAFDSSQSEQATMIKKHFMDTAMFVSCGFLLLVLIVYGLLPELRNMCGCILMAYIASLFLAFLHLAIIRVKIHSTNVCYILTLIVYYTFLASFCWMTVMSYDIWWTFRGYAKSRPIHSIRGKTFKFKMYSIYAWGVPLAMTIFVACIDEADLGPYFIKPHLRTGACFLDGTERFRYLYIPMLILICSNWMFYLMTAFNIWRLSRGTAVLDSAAAGTPAAHRTHRHRFLVYLKLAVVMGLNWVLEVASYLFPNEAWYVTDAYNFLIGIFIFIIFVCKKKILKKLLILFLKKTSKNQGIPSNSKSINSSTSDQEKRSLCKSTNPNGPGYVINNF